MDWGKFLLTEILFIVLTMASFLLGAGIAKKIFKKSGVRTNAFWQSNPLDRSVSFRELLVTILSAFAMLAAIAFLLQRLGIYIG